MTSTISLNDTLSSLTAGLGTSRDKSSTVAYSAPNLRDQELIDAYNGAWLPRKAVDMLPNECFRKWRVWQGDTDTVGKIEKEEKRLGIRDKLKRAMILARLLGRAHVYFDLGDDPALPATPERVRKGGIRFATVLSRREVSDGDIDDDPMSPYYGLPEYYELMSPTLGLVRIHPSRMVTFWGDDDPRDMVYGRRGVSILQAAFPAIKRHDGTVANVAGLVYEARVDVITVPDLGVLLADEEQGKAILDRFRLMATMKGNNGLVLLSGSSNKDTPGETWDQKNTTFATLPDIIEKAQEEVCASLNGAPRALIFGTSSGGMGSTGDLEFSNWYDMVGTVQTNDIEPALPIFDECLIYSALGNRPADLWYSWASLWQMSDKEKAEIADKITTSGVKMGTMGFPVDVVVTAVSSALVEAGLFPGLETALADHGPIEEELSEDDLPPDDGSKPINDAAIDWRSPGEKLVDFLGDYLNDD